jgi:catechol 2,3-dioxygenase-like lactoylglutathione lyase family enzyme
MFDEMTTTKEKAMARIRHLAIFSDDPEKLAEFYTDIYGMKVTGRSKGDVWVTDGHIDVALIFRRRDDMPKGLDHFGLAIDPADKPEIYAKMKARGLEPFNPRRDDLKVDRPFVEDAGRDPDGNRFDISTGMRDIEAEKLQAFQKA